MAGQTLFSEHINSAKFQEEFKKLWHSQSDFKSTNLEIISKPFKVCRISNFLRDEIVENLKCELDRHDHIRRVLDLYQLEKTEDLSCATDKCIRRLNRSFQTDLVSWMKRNTDIELNGKVSMSSARYRDTDRLLCHDDNMGDRRIAYIFYLTKAWSEEDGGALDLFDTDEDGSPRKTVKSLIPEYNSLVFFEVVDTSYHRVAEVTSDKCRWSINGWFHGPLKQNFPPLRREPEVTFVPTNSVEVDSRSWISDDYLTPNITAQIQEEVETSSYTFLKGFLKESVYQRIANDLTSRDISWRMIGPPDMRRYEIADEQTLPKLLKDFCRLFKSIFFIQLLLNKYTGLELVPDEIKGLKMTLELQRWSSGCYTLLYDRLLFQDASDESVELDQLDDDASADDAAASARASTSGFSTGEINLDANGTRRELKRERFGDSPSPANSPDKKKVARWLDSQSDVGVQVSSKRERDTGEISSSPDEKLFRSDTPASEDDSASEDDEFQLDAMIQFHAEDAKGKPKTEDTIDYVDVSERGGVLMQVPMRNNHLCLVYRSVLISRLQKYLNHLYDGYSYTFICSYYK
ncbi:prolyl 3-hydroxylase sud1 [Temnothorax americanus]|uniref:prolyl 3-hydroxylase sud1 n=1 Tax=Temnothorax americanus TaxID=1964332 RepID=UPI0040698DCD